MTKKTTVKKSRVAKGSAKKSKSGKSGGKASAAKAPKSREHALAESALKLLDQATDVLRSGIRQGAATTAKSRLAAKKKAHVLVGQATTELAKAIETGGAALQRLLGKI